MLFSAHRYQTMRRLSIFATMGLAGACALAIAVVLLALWSGRGEVSANPGAVESLQGCQNASLPANDDGSSDPTSIGFNANFFGQTYSQLYVNNNIGEAQFIQGTA